jgi:hypothetical protein
MEAVAGEELPVPLIGVMHDEENRLTAMNNLPHGNRGEVRRAGERPVIHR